MSAPHLQGPPRSTVADAMRAIVLTYAAVGDTTQFLIGEMHSGEEGSPGRITIIRGGGTSMGGPQRVGDGNVDRFNQGMTCYVWAAESLDPIGRYAALDAMLDRLINVIRARMPGRVEISTLNPATTPGIVSFGEDMQVLVTYSRGVPRDAAIWAAPVTPQPFDPMRPNGDTGTVFHVNPDATTNATR